MKNNARHTKKPDVRLVEYQTNRLQELIAELYNCCRERTLEEARAFELPRAELKCLLLFDGHKYLSGKEIAAKLEVAKSRACVLQEGLAEKGFIRKTTDPNDGRAKLVCLTVAGQRKVKEIEEYTFHLYHQLLVQISRQQRESVINTLEILQSSMKTMNAKMAF